MTVGEIAHILLWWVLPFICGIAPLFFRMREHQQANRLEREKAEQSTVDEFREYHRKRLRESSERELAAAELEVWLEQHDRPPRDLPIQLPHPSAGERREE